VKEREGEWVECGGIKMFMYTIHAPDYSNKPDKIRPKLNFEYKMELLDNKPEEKIDQ
jgi:hypothetical protein